MFACILKKVVGKSARDNPERYCGLLLSLLWASKKFKRMAREAMDVCLRVPKESNRGRFDSYSVRNKCIDHVTFRDCPVHILSDNLSRNSCMLPCCTSAINLFNYVTESGFLAFLTFRLFQEVSWVQLIVDVVVVPCESTNFQPVEGRILLFRVSVALIASNRKLRDYHGRI